MRWASPKAPFRTGATTTRFTPNVTWACPSDNPDGYRRSSPRFSAAEPAAASLLLVHGALDDNVHPQNTTQFAYELQRAGKPFQMMMYPKSAHGVSDPQLATHLRRMMLDFTTQNLLR